MIVAVTGHRPNKLGGYRTPNPYFNSIMEGLDRALLELQPERVILGMAQGVDQWMAELCIYNGIPFIAAVPFQDFELGARWPEAAVAKYQQLLRRAAHVEYVCRPPYAPFKMQRRNEWMVDHCDILLAVFDGSVGGTSNCVSYARQMRKTVRIINYLRPPSETQSVERQPLLVTAVQANAPQAQPPQPRSLTAGEVVDAFLDQRNRETEGQRIARRRAREAMEREERARRRIEEAAAQAQQRRAQQPRIQITDVEAPPPPPSPPQEEKRQEVVRDFGRFVDLDV